MQAQLKWLMALALMCAGLAAVLLKTPSAAQQDFRASRYTQIVESLYINPHLIMLDDSEGGELEGSRQIIWKAHAADVDAPLADWYYKNSYLRGDVQRFNEGTPESGLLFDLDHEQLARINPAAHTFRPSLSPHGRWTGKLMYSAESHSVSLWLQGLDESGQEIELLPLQYRFVDPRNSHGYVSLFTPSAVQQPMSIIHFRTPSGKEVADVWMMGEDGALLRLISPEPDCHVEVKIDGHVLHGTGGEVYALSRSSVLLFEDHRPRAVRSAKGAHTRTPARTSAWLVRDSVAPDVAYDGRNGLWRRTAHDHDPLLPRLQSLLAELASSNARDVDSDVRLTLSRSAEESAGGILGDALGDDGSGNTSTAVAAITLMDAMHGGLLALPSWPPGPATSTAAAAGVAEENQNFTRHSIGSVAKILFAPAVLDTHPALLHLKLPRAGSDSFESVLGIPLNRAVQDDAWNRDQLDFPTAVSLSSNRYAVTLLTLGSDVPGVSAPGPQDISRPSDYYWLDGKLREQRPRELFFNPGMPAGLSNVLVLPWVERMKHLLDLNVATVPGSDRVNRQYIWDGLPPALQPRNTRARRMFDSISPEYENLRLEGIGRRAGDFGGKFASLTLGAGESRWSNVELAEAVASLIRNRPVRASLVSSDDPDSSLSDPGFEWQALTAEVHQALADAMSGVVRNPLLEHKLAPQAREVDVKGTASELDATRAVLARAACARHQAFALFAKTGTPTLVEAHEAPEAELFNEMAKGQLFELNPKGEIIYKDLGRALTRADLGRLMRLREQGTGAIAEHFRTYFQAPSDAVQEDLRACRETNRPRVLWSRVMRMVADNNETPDFPLVRSDGPVLRYEHECATMKSPDNKNINGRHIVLLAALYPREALMGDGNLDCTGAMPHIDVSKQPTAAVAAVVAIADPQRMKLTLDVARKLLQGPIAQHLGLKGEAPSKDPGT